VNFSQQLVVARLNLQAAGIVHEAAVVVNDSASVISEAECVDQAGIIAAATTGGEPRPD
jgi:hypothetical protein